MGRVRWSAFLLGMSFLLAPAGCSAQIKEPAVAGAFYPAAKAELARKVDAFVAAAAKRPLEGRLVGIVAPHAGYEFSGAIAGHAYAHLKERPVDTVILIGPSHHVNFTGASVYTGEGMRTPLGVVPVNRKIATSLLNEKAGVTFTKAAFEKEHSLEVQLPFLQRTLKNFTIVPILIGTPSRESFDALTAKLTEIMRGNDRAIIVASTDLSHYHDATTAARMDTLMIDAVERLSVNDLEQRLIHREGEMCGGFPVLYAMAVVRNLGATNGVLYKYADSGDVTGDKRSVVGYAAMGMYRSALSAEERQEILALAKATLSSHLNGGKKPDGQPRFARLKADGACFVTLNKKGNLRGCIGNIQPMMPLYRSVVGNAIAAASRDPRFPPVKAEELPDLQVEVTVLSPLVPLASIADIRIGTHGLYLEKGVQSGVFLPQVPVEQGWDVPTYLEELALKAGLPKDGWKEGKLYSFTAETIK